MARPSPIAGTKMSLGYTRLGLRTRKGSWRGAKGTDHHVSNSPSSRRSRSHSRHARPWFGRRAWIRCDSGGTFTKSSDDSYPYTVLHAPSKPELKQAVRSADVVICHVYIVKLLWLRLAAPRTPWINVIHGWQKDPSSPASPWHPANRQRGWRGLVQDVKGALTFAGERWGSTVLTAASSDVAKETGSIARIVPNGYRDDIFRVVTPPAHEIRALSLRWADSARRRALMSSSVLCGSPRRRRRSRLRSYRCQCRCRIRSAGWHGRIGGTKQPRSTRISADGCRYAAPPD